MSDEIMVFMVGLLVGCTGTLALMFVFGPPDRRHRAAAEAQRATDADPTTPVSVTSFMHVDLLYALHDSNPFMTPSGVDADDLDLELTLLLGRYGIPSGP